MREEVSSIASLDRKSFRNLIDTLLEDKAAWTLFGGLMGSLDICLPRQKSIRALGKRLSATFP